MHVEILCFANELPQRNGARLSEKKLAQRESAVDNVLAHAKFSDCAGRDLSLLTARAPSALGTFGLFRGSTLKKDRRGKTEHMINT